MRKRLLLVACVAFPLACRPDRTPLAGGVQVLDAKVYHLGNDPTPDWPEAAADPDGVRIDFDFVPLRSEGEQLLLVQQRHVNDPWHIEINGQRVAMLERGDALGERYYVLADGVLRAGKNSFSVVGDVTTDDITVGNFRLDPRSLREVYGLREVTVSVTDEADGTPLPARVTFTDPEGNLVQVYYAESLYTAVREGVVYTSKGSVRVELPEGSYRVFATRGAEWGLGQASLEVGPEGAAAQLELAREVDTTGFVSCDTHIHTLTFSGHGDASTEERMVTLAGEGVELAISTDHNHNTDYRPYQERAGLNDLFTSVVGNEVTTKIGHFNSFPLEISKGVLF